MRRILVGLDGSARAPAVLATALSIARAEGASVILLRAVGLPPDVPQDLWKTTDEPLLDVLRRHARAYLDEESAHIPPEFFGGADTDVGVAWQAICDRARRDQVDLIVVGSHGYGGLDRLLGTTAAKVVNHAPCSVMVVREPEYSVPQRSSAPH